MAYLTSEVQFTGSLGNLSAYRMKGSDKIVLRTKGGPSKKAIATGKQFDITRRNNAEFDRRAKGSAIVLSALQPLRQVADHRISAPMNALLKKIQSLDMISDFGARDLFLSRWPGLLEGFSFNRINPFDATLMAPVTAAIQTASTMVTVIIPAVVPGVNFNPSGQYPFCQFIVTAGCVSDMLWSGNGYQKSAAAMTRADNRTAWIPVRAQSPERTMELKLSLKPADIDQTIIVGIGIQYGVVSSGGEIQAVRYGCAKILAARSINPAKT
jgi:hypothetical protein